MREAVIATISRPRPRYSAEANRHPRPRHFPDESRIRPERTHPSLDALTAAELASRPERDYFIYSANLWPHKNHRRNSQAFAQFLQRTGQPVEFVFTGHPNGWDELVKDFPGLPVRHLGFVRRASSKYCWPGRRPDVLFPLRWIWHAAPGAFAAGTPVACSNTTSLPEVGGDAVVTCAPTDVPAMCDLMVRLYRDQPLRDCLTARGKERLAEFSWHTSAAQLVAACHRVHEREPALTPAPLLPLQRLHQYLLALQADRTARLELIQRLDATLKESLANGGLYLGVIEQLKDSLRTAHAEKQQLIDESLPQRWHRLAAGSWEPLNACSARAERL